MPASRKYRARNPRMANALDAKTMNGSRLNGQDGRDRVHREDHVGGLDRMSTANSGVASSLPVRRGEHLLTVVLGGGRYHRRTSLRRLFSGGPPGLLVAGDPEGGDEQEGAEDVQDPVERLDQGDAGEDEDRPQHEGAEDAPEQDPELVLPGHAEVAEDHRPHEDVVDRNDFSMRNPTGTRRRPALPASRGSRTSKQRPRVIHTADSMAASLKLMSCGVRCTISRSATRMTTMARPTPPTPRWGRRSWRSSCSRKRWRRA